MPVPGKAMALNMSSYRWQPHYRGLFQTPIAAMISEIRHPHVWPKSLPTVCSVKYAHSDKEHWEQIYREKSVKEVSWYRPHLDISFDLIQQTGLKKDAAIIDVGGGASTLVDDLLEGGFTKVAVLDISRLALEAAKGRLGT
jgi:hypothetical protein